MTITNWNYDDDLRDPTSALYKRLSSSFCAEVSEIFMLPIYEIVDNLASGIHSTVVELAIHMLVCAGLSHTGADHCNKLILRSDKMSLFQKMHSIEHNRHDVYMYIYTKATRQKKKKEQNKTN